MVAAITMIVINAVNKNKERKKTIKRHEIHNPLLEKKGFNINEFDCQNPITTIREKVENITSTRAMHNHNV